MSFNPTRNFIARKANRRSVLAGLMLAGLMSLPALSTAGAQGAFPDRPVRLITPFGPGTGTDTFARLIAAPMQGILGQPVLVENRPGANAVTGTDAAAKSAPDGYSVLLSSDAVMCIGPVLFKGLPYDVKRDLMPVAGLATFDYMLVVNAGLPAKNIAELVALAKAKPGTISLAATGTGTAAHLLGEAFARDAGIELTTVQYQTGAAALFADMIANRVNILFYPYQFLKPYLDAGQVRALAIASAERTSVMKDLPTLDELGYKRSQYQSWFAISAPAGTPADRVTRLSNAFREALQHPDFKNAPSSVGLNIAYRTPEELGKFEAAGAERCRMLVDISGVKPQ